MRNLHIRLRLFLSGSYGLHNKRYWDKRDHFRVWSSCVKRQRNLLHRWVWQAQFLNINCVTWGHGVADNFHCKIRNSLSVENKDSYFGCGKSKRVMIQYKKESDIQLVYGSCPCVQIWSYLLAYRLWALGKGQGAWLTHTGPLWWDLVTN